MQEKINWKQTLKNEKKDKRTIHWNCKSIQNEKNKTIKINMLQQTHSTNNKAIKAKKSSKVREEAHKVHQMSNITQIK
jgi:hypothetical protein